MINPTKECLEYVSKTNAELWKDEDGIFYVVYPTAREAHMHGDTVSRFTEMYDVGAFDVAAIAASVLSTLSGVERLV